MEQISDSTVNVKQMATTETPVEVLKNLKRELKLIEIGFLAYIRRIDLYIKLAEEHPECLVEHPKYINDYLDLRKSFTNYVDDSQNKIKLLNEEIEREIQQPSEAPMIFRLIDLFGHL